MEAEVVCQHCGNNSFYRVVEIEGTAWKNAEVWLGDNGFEGDVFGPIEEPDCEEMYRSDWGCGGCGYETSKLDDLVKAKESAEQPLASIPGQLTIDDLQ